MIENRFTLELTKNGVQKTIYAKSGEFNSRKVVITLTESGKVFDTNLYVYRAYCRKEDSAESPKYWDAINVVNGCIEFVLPDEWLVEGDKVCELKVFSGTASLFSPLFRIIVDQSLGEGAEAIPKGKVVRYQEVIPDLSEGSIEEESEISVYNPEENQLRRVKLKEIVVDETDPTVPEWAKQNSPPEYTAEDVGALPADTVIPSKTSQLINDEKFITEDMVDEKVAEVSRAIPNEVEVKDSVMKFKRNGTELFSAELPKSGNGISEIPVASDSVIGGVKISRNSDVYVNGSGFLGLRYGNADIYALSVLIVIALLSDSGRIETVVGNNVEDISSAVFGMSMQLADGMLEAVVFAAFESGEITWVDENYEERTASVAPNRVYVLRFADGTTVLEAYTGKELRNLIMEGI